MSTHTRIQLHQFLQKLFSYMLHLIILLKLGLHTTHYIFDLSTHKRIHIPSCIHSFIKCKDSSSRSFQLYGHGLNLLLSWRNTTPYFFHNREHDSCKYCWKYNEVMSSAAGSVSVFRLQRHFTASMLSTRHILLTVETASPISCYMRQNIIALETSFTCICVDAMVSG